MNTKCCEKCWEDRPKHNGLTGENYTCVNPDCKCHTKQTEQTGWEKREDVFVNPTDKSTTRIARPYSGCGHHQTIAGALLKSPEWDKWYEHASKKMLYDVDETREIDAMSDGHFADSLKSHINELN